MSCDPTQVFMADRRLVCLKRNPPRYLGIASGRDSYSNETSRVALRPAAGFSVYRVSFGKTCSVPGSKAYDTTTLFPFRSVLLPICHEAISGRLGRGTLVPGSAPKSRRVPSLFQATNEHGPSPHEPCATTLVHVSLSVS